MIGRLALRSLTAHPVRSAVLASGFGVGVSVMAILLGVADVVLTQARSSDLVGGGDVVIHLEPSVPARSHVQHRRLQVNYHRHHPPRSDDHAWCATSATPRRIAMTAEARGQHGRAMCHQ